MYLIQEKEIQNMLQIYLMKEINYLQSENNQTMPVYKFKN